MSDWMFDENGGAAMDKQQQYSNGLLYSVAPDSLSSLHLNDANGTDEFDWDAYEAEYNNSLIKIAVGFLKATAAKWGIIKSH